MNSNAALTALFCSVKALVLPRTQILLLLFLTAFIWIAVILMLLLAVRLRYGAVNYVQYSFAWPFQDGLSIN